MPNPSLQSQLFFADADAAQTLSLETFEQHFNDSQEVLQQGRNTIKKLAIWDQELVVKSFKVPNAFQGFIYKFLRKSKAQRSFEYASSLISKGIDTPKPIG